MKLTVLVDNNTLIGSQFIGEPGFSLYIEEEDSRILFDMGYSDVFMRNAYKMGIDVSGIQHIVLSHGHLDHTWGLNHFITVMKPIPREQSGKKIKMLAHPLALQPKIDDGEQIGCINSEAVLRECFNLVLSKDPVWITEKLVFLGQIDRVTDFENKKSIGVTLIDGKEQEDYMWDDTALAYKSEKGLVIIAGCSHSGICNIIEHAKKVCGEDRIADVIGGFHLLKPSREQLDNTIKYMERIGPLEVHTCHCTDLESKIELAKAVNIKEVGVGMTLEYM